MTLKRKGQEFAGLSPFTSEKTASFTVAPLKGFWHCFSSGKHGDAVSWMTEVRDFDFQDALYELCSIAGVAPEDIGLGSRTGAPPRPDREQALQEAQASIRHEHAARAAREAAYKRNQAAQIWRQASLAEGSVVETYLRARGITCAVPPSLRFAFARYAPGGGLLLPAMIGIMTNGEGAFTGVHRTFLHPSGKRKIKGRSPKMMLGQARGSCVRLCPVAEHIYITEGIETALSVMQACAVPVWAALSRDNMGAADLPSDVRKVTLLADNDTRDWRAGRTAMRKAAHSHGQRGRDCYVAWPPRGTDFNDLLMRVA